ncbi:MAG: superoxide dismutase family protein [Hyphomonas sp.]|uniref:superoxide dismutase family protein n=1 Tax=Hyphomonas sp. TaxID=87 RepID=UPI003527E88E
MFARLSLAAALLSLGACASLAVADAPDSHDMPAMPDMPDMPGPDEGVFPSMAQGSAVMLGLAGQEIGSANLLDGPNGLMIRVELKPGSLTPGWHGIHLHATGNCSDIGTYKMSGGHVGMMEGGHGLFNPKGPEPGDLPNIWAGADGSAGYEAFTTLDTLGGLLDQDGSAIIIHESEDDHMTQPIGGAGARVACGAIH